MVKTLCYQCSFWTHVSRLPAQRSLHPPRDVIMLGATQTCWARWQALSTDEPALTRPDAITPSRAAAGSCRVPRPDSTPPAKAPSWSPLTPHGRRRGSRGARVGTRHPRVQRRRRRPRALPHLLGTAAPRGEPLPPPLRKRRLPRPRRRGQALSGTGAALPSGHHGARRAATGTGAVSGAVARPASAGATPAPGTRSSSTIDSRLAWPRKHSARGPATPTRCALPTHGRLGSGSPAPRRPSRLRAGAGPGPGPLSPGLLPATAPATQRRAADPSAAQRDCSPGRRLRPPATLGRCPPGSACDLSLTNTVIKKTKKKPLFSTVSWRGQVGGRAAERAAAPGPDSADLSPSRAPLQRTSEALRGPVGPQRRRGTLHTAVRNRSSPGHGLLPWPVTWWHC